MPNTATTDSVQINKDARTVTVTNSNGEEYTLHKNEADVQVDETGILGTAYRMDGIERIFDEQDVKEADTYVPVGSNTRRFQFTFEDDRRMILTQ